MSGRHRSCGAVELHRGTRQRTPAAIAPRGAVRRARLWRAARRARGLAVVLLLQAAPAALAQMAQEETAPDGQEVPAVGEREQTAAGEKAQLAREFNDPLTTVPQISLQEVYTPSNYGTDAQTNRLILRPIIPRVPRFKLFPLVQLIRPSFSLVTVPEGRGSATRTEFGDMQLVDLALLPWPGRDSGLILGFGPTFVFPTATHETAGQNAWQVGPAFAAIYKKIPGLLAGALVQNPISFAYTRSEHRALSTLLVQPILMLHVWRGVYVKSADSTWAFGWHDGSPKTLPLSLGLGYVVPREGSPPLNFFVTGEWMAYRDDAPLAPQTSVRFGITVAFPQLRPW